jgi:multidrug resistance efflux pump
MNRPRSRSLRFFWLLGLLALVASTTGAIWALNAHPHTGAVADASAGKETGPTFYGYVDVEGGVTALAPLQPGRVTKVLVHENQEITKEQIGTPAAELVRFDDTLAKQRVAEAEADLRATKDQLQQAQDLPAQHDLKLGQQKEAIEAMKRDLDAARSTLKRKEDLLKLKSPALNESEVEVARQLVLKLEAGVRAEEKKLEELKLGSPKLLISRAEQDVAAKEARVQQAKNALEECVLTAPGPGIVLQVNVNVGSVFGPQTTQPAIVFCADKPLIVRAEVEQEFAKHVAAKKAVTIYEENSTEQSWRGHVSRVARWYAPQHSGAGDMLHLTNEVPTLKCIITLDGKPDDKLRIGQRVRVEMAK